MVSKWEQYKEKYGSTPLDMLNPKTKKINDFDAERLIPKMISTEGPKLAIGDVNGDGLEDFFI